MYGSSSLEGVLTVVLIIGLLASVAALIVFFVMANNVSRLRELVKSQNEILTRLVGDTRPSAPPAQPGTPPAPRT